MQYFYIREWMMTSLGLKGNRLLAFALIWAASLNENKVLFSNSKKLASTLNISQKAAIQILKDLFDKGYIDNWHSDFAVTENMLQKFGKDGDGESGRFYVKIENWMFDLQFGKKKLNANALIVFAVIRAFSEKTTSTMTLQPSFILELAGISGRTVTRCVNKLESSNLIIRHNDNRKVKKPSTFYVHGNAITFSLAHKGNLNKDDFEKPSLEKFKGYIATQKLNLDAVSVYKKLDSQGWKDADGKPIRMWTKLIQAWSENNNQKIGTCSIPTSVEEVQKYLNENGFDRISAQGFFDFYSKRNWHTESGSPVVNWQLEVQKCASELERVLEELHIKDMNKAANF